MIHGTPVDYREWWKVLSQVEGYMAHHQSRYGFIITDMNLVVLRISILPIDNGLALGRPRADGRRPRWSSRELARYNRGIRRYFSIQWRWQPSTFGI